MSGNRLLLLAFLLMFPAVTATSQVPMPSGIEIDCSATVQALSLSHPKLHCTCPCSNCRPVCSQGGPSGGTSSGQTTSSPSSEDNEAAQQAEIERQLQLQREKEQRELEIARQKKFQEEKEQLLKSLKGTGSNSSVFATGNGTVLGLKGGSSGGLGLKTGSGSTSGGGSGALGLKTGHAAPVPMNPRILEIETSMKALRSKVPPPMEDASLSISNVPSNNGSPWLYASADVVIYGWELFGSFGKKAFPWPNAILIAGKSVIAGADGAELYLVGQTKLYEEAARYLKNPATAARFARVMQNLRQKRPIASQDADMISAASAVVDPEHSNSSASLLWDSLTSPQAKIAMVRKAAFESMMFVAGGVTEEGIAKLTQRKDAYDAAMMLRSTARTEFMATKNPREQEALLRVIADSDDLMKLIYVQQNFVPKTAALVEGLTMPEPNWVKGETK